MNLHSHTIYLAETSIHYFFSTASGFFSAYVSNLISLHMFHHIISLLCLIRSLFPYKVLCVSLESTYFNPFCNFPPKQWKEWIQYQCSFALSSNVAIYMARSICFNCNLKYAAKAIVWNGIFSIGLPFTFFQSYCAYGHHELFIYHSDYLVCFFLCQRSWKCIYNVCKVRVRCTRENYFKALIHKFCTFSPLRSFDASVNDFIEVNNELCNVLQWIFFRSHFLFNDLWNILPKYIAPMCLICTHYTCYFRQ